MATAVVAIFIVCVVAAVLPLPMPVKLKVVVAPEAEALSSAPEATLTSPLTLVADVPETPRSSLPSSERVISPSTLNVTFAEALFKSLKRFLELLMKFPLTLSVIVTAEVVTPRL